jgi:hypothetical protein
MIFVRGDEAQAAWGDQPTAAHRQDATPGGGDNAAAMRYTEARLSEIAMALLDGIDEDLAADAGERLWEVAQLVASVPG